MRNVGTIGHQRLSRGTESGTLPALARSVVRFVPVGDHSFKHKAGTVLAETQRVLFAAVRTGPRLTLELLSGYHAETLPFTMNSIQLERLPGLATRPPAAMPLTPCPDDDTGPS